MAIRKAYETLEDPERRKYYDVYGQTDFQHDDTIRNAFEVKYKNATERAKHWETYTKARTTMKVMGEVGPYYLTWFLLAAFRVDRKNGLYCIMFVIFLIAIFEI